MKTATVKIGSGTVQVWLMDTEPKRQEGMMFLTPAEVRDDQGMLFVFPKLQDDTNAFWMHNTILPLDIIYISKNKRVVNVGNGKAENDAQVKALGSYQWVLELKRGQAEKLGVKPGSVVEIPPSISTKE